MMPQDIGTDEIGSPLSGLRAVRRCAVVGCKGGDGQPRRVIDNRLACPACAQRGHENLRTLGRRYVSLWLSLRPGSPGTEPISGPGFGTNSPVRDAALAAMDDMVRWATKTEADLRHTLNLMPPKPHVRAQVALGTAITTMDAFWDKALHHPVGLSALEGCDYWRRHTDLILGWDRLKHRLPAPCPYCDAPTLIRHDGDDQVRCTLCHRTWGEVEYRHFVKMLVDEVTHDQPAHP